MTMAAASGDRFSVKLEADEQGRAVARGRGAHLVSTHRRVSGRMAHRERVARGAGAAPGSRVRERVVAV
jgi:hypothetical protein